MTTAANRHFYLADELTYVLEGLQAYHKRREQAGHMDIRHTLESLKKAGQTPRSLRAQLRRQAIGPGGLRDLQDQYPRMTDEHLDTLMRRACAAAYGPQHWIASK